MRQNLYSLIFLLFITIGATAQNSPLNMVNNKFKLTWVFPEGNTKDVGKYDKLELGIRLEEKVSKQIQEFTLGKEGLNPYDPEDISIEFTFISPSLNERKIYGFYYLEYERIKDTWAPKPTTYNWRVRFSPNELGRWSFIMKIFIRKEEVASIGSKFKCVPSESKGVIKRNYKGDETDRYLYLSETKETFFTIGHNIAHSAYYKLTPEKAERHKKWLTELADNGGNFFRLELGAPNGLPDWNNYKDYTSKMPQMWEFDDLVEHARKKNLYFILFRHHTELEHGESWDVAKWDNNPYKKGFNLANRKDYFTNEDVIKWQKLALRYIFSRWGYNPNFAFYEYQEVDLWIKELKKETGYNDKQAIELFASWYQTQQDYIRKELDYQKLFINTYATTPDYEYDANSKGLFAKSDAIGFHKYGQDKDINYDSRYEKAEKLFEIWNKPLFVEEMGVSAGGSTDFLPLYKCAKAEFHNAIWSTSFMGGAGTGLNWWWDRGIHDFKYYVDYNPLKAFFKDENLEEEKYIPQRWHNTLSLNRAVIENYALVNKDQTKVIGWVHNATHYWRNIESDCLNELIENGKFKTPYTLEDGILLGKDNNGTKFSEKKDAYTNNGGVQPIINKSFEINGLKPGGLFSKKKWYQITFYSTKDNQELQSDQLTTNIWGKLKPKFPDKANSDCSYKINYLGEGRKAP